MTLTDTAPHDKIISLRDEYQKYWLKIVNGENFALVRYGDGERALMIGKEIHAQEGWGAEEGLTVLGRALLNTLGVEDKKFVYGISCPCCDSAAYYWYSQRLQGRSITFANLFVNANFATFYKDFQNLERDAVLITNYRGEGKTYGKLNVVKQYLISDDCIGFWAERGESFIQRIISEVGDRKNLLFAISAGPMSEVIIAALFKNNPDNCYIDFGSALDFVTHDKVTRPYMISDTPYAKQNCWMFDSKKISFDVDVVLSAYRRPEVLSHQLAAVKNQTLKPKRILLYQDAVKSGSRIVFHDEFLKKFDAYEIAKENGGVWKRFEYAARATTAPYVCVFDDDTIPGQRWLENCHMNILQRGVFGTNGIVVNHSEDYYRNVLSVGWHVSNAETREVDFVGHSWFVKREYLDWMLAKPYGKIYKYAAEDMTLSFACQEHGVETFVPAHPRNILSLWGSIPKYGWSYGISDVALSVNSDNSNAMSRAIKNLHDDGWRFLFERKSDYVDFLATEMNFNILQSSTKILNGNVSNVLKLMTKRQPIFLGERKFLPFVQKLFDISPQEYFVLEDDNNEINLQVVLDRLRWHSVHIFFTDIYSELKPYLEEAHWAEKTDFVDGRTLLRLI